MAETPCRLSRPPQRNAANTSARARTGSALAAVRSSPYTARASSTRSLAHWASASDFVAYTVPSALRVPSRSPCTGERVWSAWHCIQSHAASSCQRIPALAATSRCNCSARASGALALAKNAVATAAGSGWAYRIAAGETTPGTRAAPPRGELPVRRCAGAVPPAAPLPDLTASRTAAPLPDNAAPIPATPAPPGTVTMPGTAALPAPDGAGPLAVGAVSDVGAGVEASAGPTADTMPGIEGSDAGG